MLIHDSPYLKYANQELEWLRSDTKELYESNLNDANQKIKLEKYGWVDNPFTYKFNSFGFRCKEFTTSESIIFLGCSFTIGIGLPEDKTFASIVASELKLECYNLGIGGGSNDCAFRLGRHWIPKIKPKIVILMSPPKFRYEIKNKGEFVAMVPNGTTDDCFENWALEEDNAKLNQQKNALAIENICIQNNIKILTLDIVTNFLHTGDLARDLKHYGIDSNKYTAKHILRKF